MRTDQLRPRLAPLRAVVPPLIQSLLAPFPAWYPTIFIRVPDTFLAQIDDSALLSILRAEHTTKHVWRHRRIRPRLHRPTRAALRQAAHLVRVIEHQPQRHQGLDDAELAARQ